LMNAGALMPYLTTAKINVWYFQQLCAELD
jgi:hypothetical protein